MHKSKHVRGVVMNEDEAIKEALKENQMQEITKEQKEEIEKRITKEKNRLKKLYKELPENQKKLTEKLLENAAFISVQLELMQEDIKKNGIKEFYMNGKGQFGYKESVASKTYNISIKNYMNIIKQLNDMLPPEKQINEDDEFEKFSGLL